MAVLVSSNTSPRQVFDFLFFTTVIIMDILHTQLSNIQRHLAFVAVTDINWKLYVQLFSWSVTLFESYLLYDYFIFSFFCFYNFFSKGFDSILFTPRKNLPRPLRSISNRVCLKSLKIMVKIRPSSLYSRESSSSSWIH